MDNPANNPPVSREDLPVFLYGRIQGIDSERDTTNRRLEAVEQKLDALSDEIKEMRTDAAQANLTQLRWIASIFAAGVALPLALSYGIRLNPELSQSPPVEERMLCDEVRLGPQIGATLG